MKTQLITAAIAAICLGATAARAAGQDEYHGAYAGVGAGIGGSDLRREGGEQDRGDERGGALKLYAGYQFDRHFGVEGGYLRTGRFAQTVNIEGTDVREEVKSHTWYVAGTARLPVGGRFALTATGGVSFGNVNGEQVVPSEVSLRGSRSALLAGVGAQYRISQRTDLQLDLTGIDALSRGLGVGIVTLSVKKRW